MVMDAYRAMRGGGRGVVVSEGRALSGTGKSATQIAGRARARRARTGRLKGVVLSPFTVYGMILSPSIRGSSGSFPFARTISTPPDRVRRARVS